MYHDFFNSKAQASTSPALEKLQNLYIARSFHLWKETDILPWLEECVHAVLNRIESKDDYIKYCQVKRSKRYQGRLPKNILRHIILADMKEVIVNVQEVIFYILQFIMKHYKVIKIHTYLHDSF